MGFLLDVLGPLILMIVTGLLYRWLGGRIDPDQLTDLIMNILMPCLIFDALVASDFTLTRLGMLGVANLILVGLLWVVCRGLRLLLPDLPRSFELPVLFMNAGFLGIPLLKFYGGNEGVASMVVFDQIQTLLIFTLGLAMMTTHRSWGHQIRAFLREPIVWAIGLGMGVSYAGFGVPSRLEAPVGALQKTINLLGLAAVPLALFLVGYILHRVRPRLNRHVSLALALRLGIASVLGIGICLGMGLKGSDGAAVLLGAGLPAAVFSYVLPQRYDRDPGFAAGVVFYSSVMSVFTLPALLWIARLWFPPPF